jgi:hypothetical protein
MKSKIIHLVKPMFWPGNYPSRAILVTTCGHCASCVPMAAFANKPEKAEIFAASKLGVIE